MSDDELLFAAAREVRPFLDRLVTDSTAVDATLAEALLSDEPDDVRLTRIERVFELHQELTDWFGQYVNSDAVPPEVIAGLTRDAGPTYQPVAGDPAPQPGAKFVCPNGDWVRYALRLGEDVGHCPTCGIALARADA